jgi:drug/metabolite transporter (DMT)-like permease
MLWLLYALISGLSWATTDALCKQGLVKENELVLAWVRVGYAVPFFLLIWPYVDIPQLDGTFWWVMAILIPCDIVGLLLYVRALKISPMSLTIPFLALTPVFVILTSFLILGELPSRLGLAGILLIVVGAYMLNIHTSKHGIWGPLRAIAHERGSLLMIMVAFIYSFSSTLGKLAMLHSEPVFFSMFYFTAVALVFLIILLVKLGRSSKEIFLNPKLFLSIGFFNALMILTHFLALDLTKVAYMIAVKRTHLLFGVLYGWILFGEKNIGERMLGSGLMLLGILLMALV